MLGRDFSIFRSGLGLCSSTCVDQVTGLVVLSPINLAYSACLLDSKWKMVVYIWGRMHLKVRLDKEILPTSNQQPGTAWEVTWYNSGEPWRLSHPTLKLGPWADSHLYNKHDISTIRVFRALLLALRGGSISSSKCTIWSRKTGT
jgi:hypothetical protein